MPNITKPTNLSTIWANGGTKLDPGASKYNIGWVVQLPPYEFQNWVDNRQDQAIAHFSQHGIPEWDGATEYQGNLSYTQGSNGLIYKCIATNTNKDPVNSLNSLYWVVAFESYGSVKVVSDALAVHINNYQTLSGIGNVVAARTNLSVYSKSESDARFAGLNGSSAQVFAVGVATQPEHAVRLGQVGSLLTQATETNLGVVKLATTGVTETGVDDLTAITPLKANSVYVKKSANLSGLTNYATARSNLGLGSSAVRDVTFFAQAANNLSDLASVVIARSNLGLTTTATQPESYFLRSAQNLADLANVSNARNNLGLTDLATTAPASVLFKSDNLAGLANLATARTNLGLGTAATQSIGTFLQRTNNLSDLANAQSARNNLGLGSASTMNAYGTNGSLNFSAGITGSANYMYLPNGMVEQFGYASIGENSRINFPVPMNVGSIQLTIGNVSSTASIQERTCGVGYYDNNGFNAWGAFPGGAASLFVFWQAKGWV